MSLSQTQIDEAMKPARFDSHISAVGGHSNPISGQGLPPSSILTKDKTFSSGASPINSLLAGEKIQFGKFSATMNFTYAEIFLLKNLRFSFPPFPVVRCCYISNNYSS